MAKKRQERRQKWTHTHLYRAYSQLTKKENKSKTENKKKTKWKNWIEPPAAPAFTFTRWLQIRNLLVFWNNSLSYFHRSLFNWWIFHFHSVFNVHHVHISIISQRLMVNDKMAHKWKWKPKATPSLIVISIPHFQLHSMPEWFASLFSRRHCAYVSVWKYVLNTLHSIPEKCAGEKKITIAIPCDKVLIFV